MNYYELLEVAEIASEEVIKAAYKAKIKQCHPDNFQKEEEKVKATNAHSVPAVSISILTINQGRKSWQKK